MSAAMGADFVSTSVRIPRATLAVLRRAAAERAIRSGGRMSISQVVVELAARHLAAPPPECRAAPPRKDAAA